MCDASVAADLSTGAEATEILTDREVEYELYGWPANTYEVPDVVERLRQKGVSDDQLRRCLQERDLILLEPGGKERWVNANLYPARLIYRFGPALADYVLQLQKVLEGGLSSRVGDRLAEFLATHPVPPVQPQDMTAAA